MESLARRLRVAGIATIYFVCDGPDLAMTEATDATVATTDYLRRVHPVALQSKVHVVHDGIECPDFFKVEWGMHTGSLLRPLRAVFVTSCAPARLPVLGSPPSWLEVVVVGRYAPAGELVRRMREIWWSPTARQRSTGA